jgi:hypothetical protein
VHVGQGHRLPHPEQLIELGRSAIVLYLQGIGALQPAREEAQRAGEPDLNIN